MKMKFYWNARQMKSKWSLKWVKWTGMSGSWVKVGWTRFGPVTWLWGDLLGCLIGMELRFGIRQWGCDMWWNERGSLLCELFWERWRVQSKEKAWSTGPKSHHAKIFCCYALPCSLNLPLHHHVFLFCNKVITTFIFFLLITAQ